MASSSAASEPLSTTQLKLELQEWDRCKNEEQYMMAAEDDTEGHAMLCHCISEDLFGVHCIAKIASVCIA
jgi:hypothetical protein